MKGKSAVEAFVESERTKGAADTEIIHKLLDAGWHMDIIQWAMGHVTGQRAQPQAAIVQKNRHGKEVALGSLLIFFFLGFRRFRSQARG